MPKRTKGELPSLDVAGTEDQPQFGKIGNFARRNAGGLRIGSARNKGIPGVVEGLSDLGLPDMGKRQKMFANKVLSMTPTAFNRLMKKFGVGPTG